ncbi:MAG: WD40 repeat domain-containing protein, partial [Myxococcota bacterium]|nr:WD40 repeat domain-containing protein [Myxococcota bacterium]
QQYSADGRSVYITTYTGELRRVNAADGQTLWSRRRAHERQIRGLALSRDGRFAATFASRQLRVWSAETGDLLVDREELKPLTGAAFSPDSRLIVVGLGLDDGQETQAINVRDLVSGALLAQPVHAGGTRWAEELRFSHDGRTLFAVTRPNGSANRWAGYWVEAWDAQSWASRERWRGTSYAVSHDDSRLAIGGEDGNLTVIDLLGVSADRSQTIFDDRIHSLAFTPDDAHILSMAEEDPRSRRSTLRVTRSDDLSSEDRATPRASRPFILSPDGQTLLYGGAGLIARRLWPEAPFVADELCSEAGCRALVPAMLGTQFQISHEGLFVATGSDQAVWAWDSQSASPSDHFPLSSISRRAAISADGRRIALDSAVIDRQTRTQIATIPSSDLMVFSDDSSQLGLDSRPHEISLLSGADYDQVTAYDFEPGGAVFTDVRALAIASDGSMLVGAWRGRLYSLSSAGEQGVLEGSIGATHLAFGPSDEVLYGITSRGRVQSWNMTQRLAMPEFGPEIANTLAISPDGLSMVLAYADGEWQIFETGGSTKVEGLPWPTHGGIDPNHQIGGAFTPPQAHFSGDNRYLVTASGDGMLQIWCRR